MRVTPGGSRGPNRANIQTGDCSTESAAFQAACLLPGLIAESRYPDFSSSEKVYPIVLSFC